MDGVEFIRARIARIFWRGTPVHQELAVRVELGDALAAVPVADEERAVGQPGDVGRPIEERSSLASPLPLGAERHHQLAVVGELVDHVQLIVDHPHVLVAIVRVHLDLVRPAAARHLEQLVVLRPPLHHLAVAIDDEDHMVITPLPSTLLSRLACGTEPVIVARSRTRRLEHAVGRPRLRARRQRQLTALGDPDAIGRLCIDRTDRSPRPAVVLHAIIPIGQRLRPVRHELVRSEFLLPSFFLRRRSCGRLGGGIRSSGRRRPAGGQHRQSQATKHREHDE